MLRAHIAWRKHAGLAELVLVSAGDVVGTDIIEHYLPTWHQGCDRQGRPVVFTHYGRFRCRPVLEAGITVEQLGRLHVRNSEIVARRCGLQSAKLGRDITSSLLIIDAEGLDSRSMWTRASFDWVRGVVTIEMEHYPDRMGQVVVINAPASVNCFFKALLQLVEASELPSDYGGDGPALGRSGQPPP
mmetsp:Transcript_69341/g.225110  ORF Transcript_69341/g.225110 Transcript_69341/m.225110 type:complete len:187 (-) Transcript_69341:40-600(-)